MTPIASATPMAPHETTYHGPAGFELTLGHTEESYRLVPPLNAMPTNREVFLDNTAYVTAPAGATGEITYGYLVACAVDQIGREHVGNPDTKGNLVYCSF